MSSTPREVWYRFEDYLVDDYSWKCRVVLRRFPVVKKTPCGVWLDLGLSCKRWVNQTAFKRFACPTIEEAKESFIARKKRAISIYRSRLRQAEAALQIVNERPMLTSEVLKSVATDDDFFPLLPLAH